MPRNILVALDVNYLPRLRTMLFSLHLNHPGQVFHVYLLHSSISEGQVQRLAEDLQRLSFGLTEIRIDGAMFKNAPKTDRYPQEMYYRLLAAHLLPEKLDRVLYLDPDVLIINSLDELWELDMADCMFAAAAHNAGDELITGVNRIRLDTSSEYYNSGVLLMDLEKCRNSIHAEDILTYVKAHKDTMMLPDQDVLNALYGESIYPLDDLIWNYDARKYRYNYVRSGGKADVDWVMENTSILHYCGRAKPWKENYPCRYGILYKHYMQMERRFFDGHSLME